MLKGLDLGAGTLEKSEGRKFGIECVASLASCSLELCRPSDDFEYLVDV